MKKLVLFLALCSGVASAMQSDAMPADVASTMPSVQDQADLVANVAKQLSALTPEQRDQAIAEAKEAAQKIVDSCGDDKELLNARLTQRIEKLEMVVSGRNSCELVSHTQAYCIGLFMLSLILGNNFFAGVFAGLTCILMIGATPKNKKEAAVPAA